MSNLVGIVLELFVMCSFVFVSNSTLDDESVIRYWASYSNHGVRYFKVRNLFTCIFVRTFVTSA